MAGDKRWGAVDRYLEDLFIEYDPVLIEVLAESERQGLPPINVSPLQGKFLQLIAEIAGARRILEIGTLGGYSTIWLARALPSDGYLCTLEFEPLHSQVARSNLIRSGLSEIVEIKVGLATESMGELISTSVEPFDVIFIDADKESYPEYFSLAMRLSHPGTVILVDNVIRGGAILDNPERDALVDGVREMNARMARSQRFRITQIQTVGLKGYDGFAFGIVTD